MVKLFRLILDSGWVTMTYRALAITHMHRQIMKNRELQGNQGNLHGVSIGFAEGHGFSKGDHLIFLSAQEIFATRDVLK